MRKLGYLAGLVAVIATPVLAASAEAERHDEPFYASAEFWVAVAFVIFVAAVFRPVKKLLTAALDDKSAAIKAELDEAQRLREEAQHTLAEYQRKQRDALTAAEAILNEARAEAKRIEENAATRTEASLKRREQQALDMIAAAEAQALADVRNMATDVAISATRQLLTEAVQGEKGDELLQKAIDELPGKLH